MYSQIGPTMDVMADKIDLLIWIDFTLIYIVWLLTFENVFQGYVFNI